MMGSSTDRAPQRLADNADQRMWGLMGVYTVIAVILAWIADLPLGLTAENWRSQAWMTLAYVIANVVMTIYRVDRNNSLRRTNETLTEMLFVVGVFWLTPWAFVVGRVVAAFVAWHFTKMRIQWRLYNAILYFGVATVVARTYLWISPTSPLDGWRAVVVAGSVWFLNDLIRIGAFAVLENVRYERPPLRNMLPLLSTSYLRLIACAFGLLIAIAIAVSPWALVAVGLVGVLFVIVSKSNSRASSLGAGINQISRFSAATANAETPDHVEVELVRSVEPFGRLGTVAIAIAGPVATDEGTERFVETRVNEIDTAPITVNPATATGRNAADWRNTGGGNRIEWSGKRRSGIDSTLERSRDLAKLASSPPRMTIDRKGTVAAWLLDPIRGSYLVVESIEIAADQTDLWTTVGHLVDHARLAIDTVYKSRRLTAMAEEEYERARRDPLTKLPNRLATLNEISERLARRNDEEFSLVRIESLGYQESVNLLGQDFGDAAVVAFADHLSDLDDVEFVGHIGGAQFVLIVPYVGERVRLVAELACAGPHPESASADEFAQRVAVAGIAAADGHATSAEELMRAAGIALDRAAHDDQIASFGPDDAATAERRMAIRFQLGRAIDERRIVPEFQPQISLASGLVSGCEVLARWRHAELGQVGPMEFIPVAEQSGQIERLTLVIAEQALDAARYWGDDEPLGLSINIAARSLDSPGFVRAFARLVDEAGRPPSSTTIEITESMLIDRSSMLLALERIRDLGLRISIDDFGTGYSALSYLDRLPADEVKIDQSMVRPIAPDHSVSAVVYHLIELCQALGLAVCAEGIEDQYQLNVLRSLGCDLGQGYLFSRSLTPDAMTTWIGAHRIAHANAQQQQPNPVELFDPS